MTVIIEEPCAKSRRGSIVPNLIRRTPKRGVRTAFVLQAVLTSAPLLCADLAALSLAFGTFCGLAIAAGQTGPGWLVLAASAGPGVLLAVGLYPGVGLQGYAETKRIVRAAFILSGLGITAACTPGAAANDLPAWLASCLGMIPLALAFRWQMRRFCSRFAWWGQPVLVFGDSPAAQHIAAYYHANRHLGLKPCYVRDAWLAGDASVDLPAEPIRSERLRSLRNERQAFWAVLIAPFGTASSSLINDFIPAFPRLVVVAGDERLPQSAQDFDAAGYSSVLLTNRLLLPVTRGIKATTDYIAALTGGVILLPLMVAIAAAIRLTSPGPVFYAQKRIGRYGQPFWAWKFRTMRVDAERILQDCLASDPALREEWRCNHKLKKDPRVSTVGRVLRSTSLDELPQIYNVLRGEMSFVGPRPIVTEEKARYEDAFELYVRATPGITGLWQVSGRNNTSYAERVRFDTQYVLNWSPWLDLHILMRTIKTVICRDGAY